MITKERLEETIRRVIREFKRITDPAVDELAAALEAGLRVVRRGSIVRYSEVEDSADYVAGLRDNAQLDSAETFLREIVAWQAMHSL